MQKDRLVILLESIDSKVQFTMEAVSALDNKIDSVEERLSSEIAEVRTYLAAHRNSTELHKAPSKRPLKRV